MDNNPQQPGAPGVPTATPTVAATPQVNATPAPAPSQMPAAPTFQPVVQQQEEHKNGMKMIMMLFIIIVLVIAVLAGGYWFMSNQVKQTTAIPAVNENQQAQKQLNDINDELGSVEALESEDAAFVEVDADTKTL